MAFVEWDDSLSVGVAEIDEQHKKEAELLSQLHDSAPEDRAKVMSELVEHTKLHFDTEEKYFDEFGFEDAEEHKAAHKEFLADAARIKEDVDAGKELSEDTFNTVKTWLVNHITSMDQKYTKCFNDHGLH